MNQTYTDLEQKVEPLLIEIVDTAHLLELIGRYRDRHYVIADGLFIITR